jgi:DNA-binding transcriptional LysR family regulator
MQANMALNRHCVICSKTLASCANIEQIEGFDMAPRPPLSTLETAAIAARHASFSEAALRMGITHGAVSRKIAALETWLGIPVFERHGRGVRLTPDGQRFIAQVDEAFRQIDLASDRWSKRGSSVVRLSVLPSFAKLWLFERIRHFEKAADCRIEFAIESRNLDIERGEVDMAIRYGRGRWPNVDIQQLGTEYHFPIAHRVTADILGDVPSPEELLTFPLIHDSDATGWRDWFRQTFNLNFKPRPTDRRFEDYALTLAAAEYDMGIALARTPLANGYLQASTICQVHPSRVLSPLNYYLLTRIGESREVVSRLAVVIRTAIEEPGDT